MPTISILNPKGGSGKTTLTINLARALHDRGRKVLLVDTDPQGSAKDWHAANESNPVPLVAMDRAGNLKTLPNIAKDYEIVLIDGAAKLEDVLAAAIKQSDIVLIPISPSPLDLWAVRDLVDMIKMRHEVTDGKPQTAFVITKAVQGTKLATEIEGVLKDSGFGLLSVPLMQRQVYPQTTADGLCVLDSNNAEAKAELNALTDQIENMLKGGA